MKKKFDPIFLRYLIFAIVILVLVVLLSMCEARGKVKVAFGDESVDVRSKPYSMNIPYHMVKDLELVDLPDLGDVKEGQDNQSLSYGTWENETWGDYTAVLDLAAQNAIVVYLDDGRIFVFSRRNNEYTAEDFAVFEEHLK